MTKQDRGVGVLLSILCLMVLAPGCSPTSEATPGPSNAGVAGDNDKREGGINRVDCQEIVGWAWVRGVSDATVAVDIYDGDDLLASVKADVFRDDLVRAGKGDGKHGFSYNTPARLIDGKSHVIHVRLTGSSDEIAQSPQTLSCKKE